MTHDNAKQHGRSALSDTAADFEWKGTWNEFVGKAKSVWGELLDDDLQVARGDFQQALGIIQRKTGEGLESIRRKFFE